MLRLVQQQVWAIAICCLVLTQPGKLAFGQSVVPFSIGGLYTNNTSGSGQSGWGGFGAFDYGGSSVTAGSEGLYGSFLFDSVDGGGSGTGWTFGVNPDALYNSLTGTPILGIDAADFPKQDRAAYGVNFNPDDYVIEVEYKPGPSNAATVFNITLEQHDGFMNDPAAGNVGKRVAEQLQWGFNDIVNYHTANVQPNGYARISQGLTDGNGVSTSVFEGPSFLFASGDTGFRDANVLLGDTEPDFGDFENLVPNGGFQIHLQSSFSAMFPERLQVDVRSIRIRPRDPDPTLAARFDSRSGIGRRFGTPFSTQDAGGADQLITYDTNGDGTVGAAEFAYIRNTDQLQRFNQSGFTNLIVNTDDDGNLGGFGVWQDPVYQTFDGTQATIDVRAKLTAPLGAGQADRIDIALNDLDGNDTGPGAGGEEYRYQVDLNQFNTSTFTTVSIPLTAFTQRAQAFELLNPGDESLSDFNLYYLGVLTLPGIGVVDLEIESIEVRLPAPPGLAGDYNENGVVDAADYTLWRDNLGGNFDLGGNGDETGGSAGVVEQADYNLWKTNFGNMAAGSGTALSAAGVPEPNSLALGFLAIIALTCAAARGRFFSEA